MKITGNIGPDGKLRREIDFRGSTLPDGRNIDEVLGENETLKKDVIDLQEQIREESSILSLLIPRRKLRLLIEVILLVFSVLGIFSVF